VAPPRRADLTAPTDAIVAHHAGLRALSLVSVDAEGTLGPHYHQPTDTPGNVDWHSVEQCTRLAGGIARVWDAAS
jgi:Iap family predicted aminopeptidase